MKHQALGVPKKKFRSSIMFNIEFLISFYPYVLPDQAFSGLSPETEGYHATETEEPAVSGATFVGGIEIPGYPGAGNDEDFIIVPAHKNNKAHENIKKNKPSENSSDPLL